MDSKFQTKLDELNVKFDDLIRFLEIRNGIEDIEEEHMAVQELNYRSSVAEDEEVEVPIFSGINLGQWISQMEEILKFYEIPDIQWVNFSSIYVDGIAKDWVTVHFEQVCWWSWEEFTNALCLQFGSHHSIQESEVGNEYVITIPICSGNDSDTQSLEIGDIEEEIEESTNQSIIEFQGNADGLSFSSTASNTMNGVSSSAMFIRMLSKSVSGCQKVFSWSEFMSDRVVVQCLDTSLSREMVAYEPLAFRCPIYMNVWWVSFVAMLSSSNGDPVSIFNNFEWLMGGNTQLELNAVYCWIREMDIEYLGYQMIDQMLHIQIPRCLAHLYLLVDGGEPMWIPSLSKIMACQVTEVGTRLMSNFSVYTVYPSYYGIQHNTNEMAVYYERLVIALMSETLTLFYSAHFNGITFQNISYDNVGEVIYLDIKYAGAVIRIDSTDIALSFWVQYLLNVVEWQSLTTGAQFVVLFRTCYASLSSSWMPFKQLYQMILATVNFFSELETLPADTISSPSGTVVMIVLVVHPSYSGRGKDIYSHLEMQLPTGVLVSIVDGQYTIRCLFVEELLTNTLHQILLTLWYIYSFDPGILWALYMEKWPGLLVVVCLTYAQIHSGDTGERMSEFSREAYGAALFSCCLGFLEWSQLALYSYSQMCGELQYSPREDVISASVYISVFRHAQHFLLTLWKFPVSQCIRLQNSHLFSRLLRRFVIWKFTKYTLQSNTVVLVIIVDILTLTLQYIAMPIVVADLYSRFIQFAGHDSPMMKFISTALAQEIVADQNRNKDLQMWLQCLICNYDVVRIIIGDQNFPGQGVAWAMLSKTLVIPGSQGNISDLQWVFLCAIFLVKGVIEVVFLAKISWFPNLPKGSECWISGEGTTFCNAWWMAIYNFLRLLVSTTSASTKSRVFLKSRWKLNYAFSLLSPNLGFFQVVFEPGGQVWHCLIGWILPHMLHIVELQVGVHHPILALLIVLDLHFIQLSHSSITLLTGAHYKLLLPVFQLVFFSSLSYVHNGNLCAYRWHIAWLLYHKPSAPLLNSANLSGVMIQPADPTISIFVLRLESRPYKFSHPSSSASFRWLIAWTRGFFRLLVDSGIHCLLKDMDVILGLIAWEVFTTTQHC